MGYGGNVKMIQERIKNLFILRVQEKNNKTCEKPKSKQNKPAHSWNNKHVGPKTAEVSLQERLNSPIIL